MRTHIRDGKTVTCVEGDAVDRRLSRLSTWARTDEPEPAVETPVVDEPIDRFDDDGAPLFGDD